MKWILSIVVCVILAISMQLYWLRERVDKVRYEQVCQYADTERNQLVLALVSEQVITPEEALSEHPAKIVLMRLKEKSTRERAPYASRGDDLRDLADGQFSVSVPAIGRLSDLSIGLGNIQPATDGSVLWSEAR